jgi:hypothetical protein
MKAFSVKQKGELSGFQTKTYTPIYGTNSTIHWT